MNASTLVRTGLTTTAVACVLGSQLTLAGSASAVTVASGSLTGGQLRVQGGSAAPGIFVTARSATSSAGVRADLQGRFTIRASGFSAPDCKVTVSDSGRTPVATITLSGCTPSVTPAPATPPAATGSCVIMPQSGPLSVSAQSSSVVYFTTSGCDTTSGTGATPTPVQWKVTAGVIPTGMTGPNPQGRTSANLIGTPTVPGSYTFTLGATDSTGASDQETFTVAVR